MVNITIILNKNKISLGKLVISNRSSKLKSIDTIDWWTEAFTNISKILIQKYPLLSSHFLTYMSIIRSVVADTPFERIIQYDKQFRLRVAQNHAKTWSQIDGFLWLQFIAKCAHGVFNAVVHDNLTTPCFNYNFIGVCYRFNCIYKHNCMKCSLVHPAIICLRFHRINGYQTLGRGQDSIILMLLLTGHLY